jgi:hypothetical protein
MVQLNHENKNPTKYNWLLHVVFETTNLRTHESMHFFETMKIGANK